MVVALSRAREDTVEGILLSSSVFIFTDFLEGALGDSTSDSAAPSTTIGIFITSLGLIFFFFTVPSADFLTFLTFLPSAAADVLLASSGISVLLMVVDRQSELRDKVELSLSELTETETLLLVVTVPPSLDVVVVLLDNFKQGVLISLSLLCLVRLSDFVSLTAEPIFPIESLRSSLSPFSVSIGIILASREDSRDATTEDFFKLERDLVSFLATTSLESVVSTPSFLSATEVSRLRTRTVFGFRSSDPDSVELFRSNPIVLFRKVLTFSSGGLEETSESIEVLVISLDEDTGIDLTLSSVEVVDDFRSTEVLIFSSEDEFTFESVLAFSSEDTFASAVELPVSSDDETLVLSSEADTAETFETFLSLMAVNSTPGEVEVFSNFFSDTEPIESLRLGRDEVPPVVGFGKTGAVPPNFEANEDVREPLSLRIGPPLLSLLLVMDERLTEEVEVASPLVEPSVPPPLVSFPCNTHKYYHQLIN